MGAAAVVTAQTANYELSVKTEYQQYYEAEKVLTTGELLKDGAGVPDARIFLTYTDPNYVIYGLSLGIPTDKEGRYEYIFTLPKEAALGEWTVIAACNNPDIWTSNVFTVVSKTIDVEAYGPYEGTVGVPIQLSGSATGGKTPYTWSWSFGDGGISDQQNPSYSYSTVGTFTAKLVVKDFGGIEGSDTAEVTITTGQNNPPGKPAIAGPISGVIGVEYEYIVTAIDPDGDTVSYYVDWGSGNSGWTDFVASGTPVVMKHTWTENGTYAVKAKAKDVHELEGPFSDILNVQIGGSGTTLEVTGKGGVGFKLIITNIGDVDALNVEYNVTLKGGIIIKPKQGIIEGSQESIAAGTLFSHQAAVFGISFNTQITGDVTADNAPSVHVTGTAIILGPFVLRLSFHK